MRWQPHEAATALAVPIMFCSSVSGLPLLVQSHTHVLCLQYVVHPQLDVLHGSSDHGSRTAAGCTYAVLLQQPALLHAMLGAQPCSLPGGATPSTVLLSLIDGCSIADLSHDTAALARAAQLRPQLLSLLHELQEAEPSLLALAAALGDAATQKALLALPGGRQLVSQADRLQRLPLWWAVASGKSCCAAVLLAAGANPEARDAQGCTPLLQVRQLIVRQSSVMPCARCCSFTGCLLWVNSTGHSRA